MKTAIVGAGALGLYYGAMLAKSGVETHFVFRSDYDAAVAMGVRVETADGAWTVRPRCHRRPEEAGPCDLVVIGLKTTANAALRSLVPPLVHADSAVLTLQNGLGNEEALETFLPIRQILGGLCFVSLNRTAPAVVRHLHGGRILMGEHAGAATPRTRAVATLLGNAGIPCEVTDDLTRAHWLKLVWNIPFNGLGVAGAAGLEALRAGRVAPGAPLGPVAPTDVLLRDSDWRAEAAGLMGEVIGAANALGCGIDASYAERELRRTEAMGAYRASTLVDFEKNLPLELESLFLEPLRQARAAGVETPRLERLCRVLESLAARAPA